MSQGSHRVAVIDVGTNSARLLVADVADGRVSPVERRSTVTRLGRGVDLSGRLSAEAIEDACAAIGGYVATIEELGAEAVEAIATSAVRDAENGSAFVAELRERFALSARVLDGEEEARLTYLGATVGAPADEPTLVVDIGGGSTELIVGTGAEISFHASLQAGVVRHSERHVASDPPTVIELEALAADVRGLIEAAVDDGSRPARESPSPAPRPRWPRSRWDWSPMTRRGSTATSSRCPRSSGCSPSSPPPRSRGGSRSPGMHPDRAPTIVAGVVILIETMRAFDLEQIEVSEHDILYGTAISVASSRF